MMTPTEEHYERLLAEANRESEKYNGMHQIAVMEIDRLRAALTDTLCELTACANQLAARGLKGHDGDSVSRAQTAAREALNRVVGGSSQP